MRTRFLPHSVGFLGVPSISEFEWRRELGEGQFGVVWLATDRALGVERAVKIIPAERILDQDRVYEEAQTLRELSHDNVVRVEDAGRLDNGGIYVAMEYVERGSIQDEYSGGLVPARLARSLVAEACRGLEYTHNHGYVHRDIKPANILIGGSGVAKLSDFGLATLLDESGVASPYGYTIHCAPEMISDGEASVHSDIYSIGVTLYRLVNGDAMLQPPGTIEELEAGILAGSFPDRTAYRPFVPRRLRTIINKAMNVDPRLRYQSASEFRHALEQATIKCDWDFETTADGVTWHGQSDERIFEVRVVSGTRSWTLETRMARIGKPLRRVTADCARVTTRRERDRMLKRILTRISEEGR